ncbi:biotin-dependent carboxyltransferase family protein [Pseudoalteromonas fenneropenaei]|uniref:Biotin-dependent carboxyltransferase family protein n=1 Tax=Pseudoalteromonas fenneropenaei TaxID=1737459 RepID=A0ABV7CHP2_9GAMM
MTITVIAPGPLTTIQDLGRHGYRHLGVATAGVLDPLALRLGNRLVGNQDNAAGLEITFGNAQLRFDSPCTFVLMGACLQASLDQQPIAPGFRIQAKKGSMLQLRGRKNSLRAYLCVAGGIAVDTVMDSCATDLQAQFGGLKGRALQAGDVIKLGTPPKATLKSCVGFRLPPYQQNIRVLPGPHRHLLPNDAFAQLLEHDWQIAKCSNRMGARLDTNDNAQLHHHLDLPSQAVHPGVIQLPPSGSPIVLLQDCQTTGGYPIIGQVVGADLRHFAQLGALQYCRFVAADFSSALAATREQELHLARADIALNYNNND